MSEKKTNSSRRDFLRAGGMAAAGIVLTPIAIACGGEEASSAGTPTPRKGKGPKKNKNKNKDKNKNNAAAEPESDLNLVAKIDNAGSLVCTALAAKAWTPKALTVNADVEKVAAAWKDRGGAPYDESVGYTNAKAVDGKFAVANVLFMLTPKDAKTPMLKYEMDAMGVNRDFRFTRVLVCGNEKKAGYKIYDNVSHNVTVKSEDGEERLNESKTSDAGVPLTSKDLYTGAYATNCSMHNWEKGFIFATEHAAFGVTGCDLDGEDISDHNKARSYDGKVTIENLAPGKYDLEVIYEGKRHAKTEIEVKAGAAASYDAKF